MILGLYIASFLAIGFFIAFIFFFINNYKKNLFIIENKNLIANLEQKNISFLNDKNFLLDEIESYKNEINLLKESYNQKILDCAKLNFEVDSEKKSNQILTEDLKNSNYNLQKLRDSLQNALSENSALKSEKSGLIENNQILTEDLKNSNYSLQKLRDSLQNALSENSALKSEKSTLAESLKMINESLLPQFKNMAMNLLSENSEKFNLNSQEKLSVILNPLGEKIKNFQEIMTCMFNEDGKEKSSLKEAINSVVNSNENVKKEASRLTNALKGNRIMLGHWGEIALENILNSSGLRKDQDYFLQICSDNNHDSALSKLKPDVLIKLPDEKYVIVDSKISFFNYSGYEDANNDEERLVFVKQFVAGLKNHIEMLSSKEYHANLGLDTPEITLMFIPVESWYNTAIKHYPELYNFAWNKNIAIVSPSTLFVVLKTIAYIWKGKIQAKNSMAIASMGGKIYDSIVEISDVLIDLGKSIEKSSSHFDKVMTKLQHGRGNLIGRAEKMRTLGVKNNKVISSDLIHENLIKGEVVEIEKNEL